MMSATLGELARARSRQSDRLLLAARDSTRCLHSAAEDVLTRGISAAVIRKE